MGKNAKIALAMKKRWADPEYRAKQVQLWHNPQFRHKLQGTWNKLSIIRKKQCEDENVRKQISESNNQRWTNPEYRQKMSVISQRVHADPDYKKKISVANARRWTDPIFRSKMEKLWHDKQFLDRMSQIRLQMPKTSRQQEILYSLLTDLNIKHYRDTNKECRIGFYSLDCLIPPQEHCTHKKSIIIEVNGDYWHNLPKIIKRDKSKATYLGTYFPQYDLKYLWEHEFNNKDRIIQLLKYWLGLDKPTIKQFNFENVTERIIDSKTAELLISKYHYAGRIGRSGVNLGYYLGDILIAVIIYVPPVRQEVAVKQKLNYKQILELSRLVIHPEYQAKNLASYLIAKSIRYIRNTKPEIMKLVSFADTTHNHLGIIYKACNWTKDGEVTPDYWYSDNLGYVCHKKTLWNHAKKMQMTESEYCRRFNYIKVWGNKKHRFIYDL